MSIDREFTFLNQSKNSLNDWRNAKVSVDKLDNKPSKVVNFVKNSSLKYLICALLLTWWVASSKIDSKKVNYDRSGDYLISMEENDIKFSIENANTIISKNGVQSLQNYITNQNHVSKISTFVKIDDKYQDKISSNVKKYIDSKIYVDVLNKHINDKNTI